MAQEGDVVLITGKDDIPQFPFAFAYLFSVGSCHEHFGWPGTLLPVKCVCESRAREKTWRLFGLFFVLWRNRFLTRDFFVFWHWYSSSNRAREFGFEGISRRVFPNRRWIVKREDSFVLLLQTYRGSFHPQHEHDSSRLLADINFFLSLLDGLMFHLICGEFLVNSIVYQPLPRGRVLLFRIDRWLICYFESNFRREIWYAFVCSFTLQRPLFFRSFHCRRIKAFSTLHSAAGLKLWIWSRRGTYGVLCLVIHKN